MKNTRIKCKYVINCGYFLPSVLYAGLSSPFCSLYLTSSNSSNAMHHSTSVKLDTLKPVWKEEFQLWVPCTHRPACVHAHTHIHMGHMLAYTHTHRHTYSFCFCVSHFFTEMWYVNQLYSLQYWDNENETFRNNSKNELLLCIMTRKCHIFHFTQEVEKAGPFKRLRPIKMMTKKKYPTFSSHSKLSCPGSCCSLDYIP